MQDAVKSTMESSGTRDHATLGGSGRPHEARLDYGRVAPEAVRAQRGMEAYVRSCGLESSLIELVKLRASQINGCAYCVDMHTKDARYAGEAEQRLYAVPVWRETPFFTPRERAALAWTETVTEIAQTRVPDEAFEEVREHFSEAELVALTMVVITINGWNRLAVSFRTPVGGYVAGAHGRPAAPSRAEEPTPAA
jgi:AhpD family alkylhydroperoxidase